jgi:hypothetical protein
MDSRNSDTVEDDLRRERPLSNDLFCLGALFYEIILGKPPYEELGRDEVIQGYAEQKFPSLEDIEPSYATIIRKCWHDDYSSIQDLICDFPQLHVG